MVRNSVVDLVILAGLKEFRSWGASSPVRDEPNIVKVMFVTLSLENACGKLYIKIVVAGALTRIQS